MSKLIFKTEMFHETNGKLTLKKISDIAQKAFDEWLEKQTVVYAAGVDCFWGLSKETADTHKAYLVCIEGIKKCEHKEVTIVETRVSKDSYGFKKEFKCEYCNKQLKPKNGWEEL